MKQYSLLDDLSTLTTIPYTSLEKLVDKSVYCICNDVVETILGDEKVITIKIGIGTLKMEITDSTVIYRFEPSKDLESNINKTIQDKKSPLVDVAEKTLVKKIVNTYKDFI